MSAEGEQSNTAWGSCSLRQGNKGGLVNSPWEDCITRRVLGNLQMTVV